MTARSPGRAVLFVNRQPPSSRCAGWCAAWRPAVSVRHARSRLRSAARRARRRTRRPAGTPARVRDRARSSRACPRVRGCGAASSRRSDALDLCRRGSAVHTSEMFSAISPVMASATSARSTARRRAGARVLAEFDAVRSPASGDAAARIDVGDEQIDAARAALPRAPRFRRSRSCRAVLPPARAACRHRARCRRRASRGRLDEQDRGAGADRDEQIALHRSALGAREQRSSAGAPGVELVHLHESSRQGARQHRRAAAGEAEPIAAIARNSRPPVRWRGRHAGIRLRPPASARRASPASRPIDRSPR